METIVINNNNLTDKDINEYGKKVRAVLFDEEKILISCYGGVILLPGGSIDKNETSDQAIVRELKEETGIIYNIKDLKKLLVVKHYQQNYLTRNESIKNRLISTEYYIGKYQGINLDETHMTDKELKDNFNLKLVNINELQNLLNKITNNPRKNFFDEEIREVIHTLTLKK